MLILKKIENLNYIISTFKNRKNKESLEVEKTVKDILNKVKNEGDKALIEYTQLFDKVKLDNLVVSYDELKEAASLVDNKFYQALEEQKKI